MAPKSTNSIWNMIKYHILFKEGMNKTNLASFRIPQKIGPVGIGLHSPELEEFFQTKFDNPSRDLIEANSYIRKTREEKKEAYIVSLFPSEVASVCLTNADSVNSLHH